MVLARTVMRGGDHRKPGFKRRSSLAGDTLIRWTRLLPEVESVPLAPSQLPTRLSRGQFSLPPRPDIESLYSGGECRGRIDIPLWYMYPEAIRDQDGSYHQKEAECQHYNGWIVVDEVGSGSAAKSIARTATVTAAAMIGKCSVIPTAVRIKSTEKTMSSIRTWMIAELKVSVPRPTSNTSSLGLKSMLWCISLVAFQTRKSPPAIRMRSRQENLVSKLGSPCGPGGPCIPKSITGAVRPVNLDGRQQSEAQDRASPIPTFGLSPLGLGSLLDRIE